MNIAAATNMPLTSELIKQPAETAAPETAYAGNRELEELAGLFSQHHQMIFRIAYRMTGSRSDAEDVLQTIFLRLAPHGRELAPSPEAYLHRAAVNASLDLLRSRGRSKAVSLETVEVDQSPVFAGASPEDELADAELRELIRTAVGKLEGQAAAAFALRYFEGYDNRRIAEILGTSQMVVGVTLHRARARLRKEIGSYLANHQ